MTRPLEVELKLDIHPENVAALEAAAPLAGRKAEQATLAAVYFDTPDGALHAAGFSLRIRREGDRLVQTIKADAAAAGLFVRPEWERDVADETPVVDAAGAPLAHAVGEEALTRLERVFTIDVERRVHRLEQDGAGVELAIDQGAIRAGDASEAIGEVELELSGPDPRPLFALARALDEAVPLRLGVLSKAERGYRLAAGRAGGVVKGEPVRFDAEAGPIDAFAAIARACLRQFRLNEAALAVSGAADALHQARVGLRRLRSAFSLFNRLLAEDAEAERLRAELRWLAGELGELRNVDVLLARMGEEAPAPLRSARAERLARVEDALGSRRTRLLMIDLAEWLACGAWREAPADPELAALPLPRAAAELLERHRKRLKRKGRGLAGLSDPERHEVRIEAKKLRYATEFFAPLYPEGKPRRRYKAFLAAMEHLQDELGELNDLATAPGLMAELGLEPPPAPTGKARRKLLDRAEDAYEALIDAKPFWRL